MNTQPKVAIIMGSKSDKDKIQKAVDTLGEFEIPHVVRVLSAHRTPHELEDFVASTNADVFICAAGMSAALAGVVASHTTKPVIGLPLSGSDPNTQASLLSTIQMPPGIPVMSVGVDAAKNAAIAAIRIISLSETSTKAMLNASMEGQACNVLTDDANILFDIKKNNFTM